MFGKVHCSFFFVPFEIHGLSEHTHCMYGKASPGLFTNAVERRGK